MISRAAVGTPFVGTRPASPQERTSRYCVSLAAQSAGQASELRARRAKGEALKTIWRALWAAPERNPGQRSFQTRVALSPEVRQICRGLRVVLQHARVGESNLKTRYADRILVSRYDLMKILDTVEGL